MSSWLNFLIKKHKKLCKRLGLTKRAKFLGRGAFGEVYESLDSTRVVKLTMCDSEYEKVLPLVGKRIDCVVNYHKAYSVHYSTSYTGIDNLYVIVMERLYPIPAWAKTALRNFGASDKRSFAQRSLRWVVRKTPDEYKFIKQIDRGWLQLLSLGIRHNDIHEDNVMLTHEGNFKLIDVM